MKKQKAHAALVASVLCALSMGYAQGATPVQLLTTEPAPVYQSDLDNQLASYPGELSGSNAIDTSTIRVVRRGENLDQVKDAFPTRVDADSMHYVGSNGDIDAQGNVIIVQGNRELRAPRITGNVNSQEYNASGGPYTFLEDGGKQKNMTGESLNYGAATQHVVSKNVQGYSEPYYFKAKHVEFKNNVGHITNGMVTTKNAMAFKHTPDYRIESPDITVYPNDKAILKHPAFYIKNTKIFSLPYYKVSLRHDKSGKFSVFSLIPRPMYDSDDGLGLKGDVSIPSGRNGEWYAKYQLFSKAGFKPDVGYRRYLPWGEASFGYSKEDATLFEDKVWVEKIGELRVNTNAYHLGDTPFTIRAGASTGYWKEGDIKGMHYKYYTELSHDVVHPWKNAAFRAFTGYQWDFYKTDGTVRSMPYWGGTLQQRVSPRLTLWAGYKQRNMGNNSPYPFDEIEIPKEITYGGNARLTSKDDVSLNIRQNADTGKVEYRNWTYHRDLHSFDIYVTYKDVQDKIEFKWEARDF